MPNVPHVIKHCFVVIATAHTAEKEKSVIVKYQ